MSGSLKEKLKAPVRVTFAAVALGLISFALFAARDAKVAVAQAPQSAAPTAKLAVNDTTLYYEDTGPGSSGP